MPDTDVVALTSVLDDSMVVDTMRAGAIGYLLKDTQAHHSALLVVFLLPMLYFFMMRPLQARDRESSSIRGGIARSPVASREARRRADVELTRANEALQTEQGRSQAMAVEAQRRADELDAVFTVMVDAVLVYDATASCCGENPAAAKMLGATTLEQLNAARLAQLGRIRSTGGEHAATDDLPFSHALRGEIVRDRQFIVGDGEDGRKLTMLASASPLIVGGSVSGAVSVWHDVTERARLAALEERQHLARAGEPPVPLEFKQAIYRIALEGMRNAAKHSHANQLALRLRCCNDSVMLEVRDDGVGFDPAKPYPGHLGLSSNRWSLRRARRRLR